MKTTLPALPLSVILVGFMSERQERRYSRFAPIIEAHVVRRTEGIALEWCDAAPELTRAQGEIPTQLDDFGGRLLASSRAKSGLVLHANAPAVDPWSV